MRRRLFLSAVPASIAAAFVALNPRPLFASVVRQSVRRWNRNGQPHVERATRMVMPYTMLEDPQTFHDQAELVRLAMIDELRKVGAPINVWRVGQMVGASEGVYIHDREGEIADHVWRDRHHFYVRTRASVETPPFTHEG